MNGDPYRAANTRRGRRAADDERLAAELEAQIRRASRVDLTTLLAHDDGEADEVAP